MDIGSLKPNQGRTWKRLQRIKLVSLLENNFVHDADIARVLGITVGGVQMIKKSPEYLAIRIADGANVVSVYEHNVLMDQDIQKQELQAMIPLAFHAIKRALSDPSHPYHVKAAMNLLDRNKATMKVSRMEHTLAEVPEMMKDNKNALELVDILAKQPGDTILDDFRDKPAAGPQLVAAPTENEMLLDASSVKNYRPKAYNPEIAMEQEAEKTEADGDKKLDPYADYEGQDEPDDDAGDYSGTVQ